MRLKVTVRLRKIECDQEAEGILSNEEPGRIGEPILLIDGKEWTGRYDMLRTGGAR